MAARQTSSSKRSHSKDIQVKKNSSNLQVLGKLVLHFHRILTSFKDINEDDCEELEPGSGSILSGNPGRASRNKPNSLNLTAVGKKFDILIPIEEK